MSAPIETANGMSDGRFARDLSRGYFRGWLNHSLIRTVSRLGAVANVVAGSRSRDRFGILMYHRVAEPVSGLPSPTISVTPQQFRRQLLELAESGFVIWPLRKLIYFRSRGLRIPPYVTAITFDDGFAGVYEHALPILRELRVPATLFINTAYLGSLAPFPFDDWGIAHQDQLPPSAYRSITCEQVDELHQSGLVEIGSHTHSHQDFRGRPAELTRDIERSLEIIREIVGPDPISFAFPYGTPSQGFASDDLIEAARNSGVICALNTGSELIGPDTSPFHWGRFNVFPWDTGASLAAKLGGWYSWGPQLKQTIKRWFVPFGGANEKVVSREPSAIRLIDESLLPVAATRISLPDELAARALGTESTRDRISVIVPTYNRAHWVGGAIESLCQQEVRDLFDYEIIVIDNASRDETAKVIADVATSNSIPVRYLHQSDPGDAPTRNFGLQHATGNWFAFFDDDQLADPHWLRELYVAAKHLDAEIVGGPVHLALSDEELSRLDAICRQALRELDCYPELHPYTGNKIPGTGNALVRKTVFDRIGMFDASMRGGGSDSDFFMRARRSGHPMWYTPRAIIRHRIAPQRLSKEHFRWDALAGGAGHAAYFDYQQRGAAWMTLICGARLGHALGITLPRMAWAKITGNDAAYLGRKTKWWRAEGYLRRTLRVLFPRICRQEKFFNWLEFRNGRTVGN